MAMHLLECEGLNSAIGLLAVALPLVVIHVHCNLLDSHQIEMILLVNFDIVDHPDIPNTVVSCRKNQSPRPPGCKTLKGPPNPTRMHERERVEHSRP